MASTQEYPGTGQDYPLPLGMRLLRPFNACFENRLFACRTFEFRGNEIVVRMPLIVSKYI